MHRNAARFFAPVLVTAGLLVGAAAPATAAPLASAAAPKAWAGKVCTAVNQWVDGLQDRADGLKVTRRATKSKKALLAELAAASKATGTLVSKLKSAGAPSGAGGKKVAKTTRDAYAQVQRTINQTSKALKKTKPKQLAKFINRARLAQDSMENGLERVEGIFGSTKGYDGTKLLAGFAAAGSCAKLSKTTTAASASEGPQGPVSISSVTPASGPTGTLVSYEFAGADADARARCVDSSAYRVEVLGPDGAQVGFGGDSFAVPATAPTGLSSIRVVCYFPGRYDRQLMRSLCGQFEVTAAGATGTEGGQGAPCPQTGRVLNGEAVIGAQRALGESFNLLVGTIYGP